MPRTAITATRINLDGVTIDPANGTAGDVANGNSVAGNNGLTLFVAAANTSADTAYDVTFVTPGTVGSDALAIADKVEELAFGTKKAFGPFPLDVYGTTLQIDVEHAAIKLSPFYI